MSCGRSILNSVGKFVPHHAAGFIDIKQSLESHQPYPLKPYLTLLYSLIDVV